MNKERRVGEGGKECYGVRFAGEIPWLWVGNGCGKVEDQKVMGWRRGARDL